MFGICFPLTPSCPPRNAKPVGQGLAPAVTSPLTNTPFSDTLFYRVILKGELTMNTPATDLTAARDDLRFIREVLDRTAPSFRPLAPSFFRAGLVWLLFALLRFSVSGLDLLAYLWPSLSALQLFGDARPFLGDLFQRGLLLFCLVLCLLWQREKRALVKLPRLLLSVWQVALLLLVVFTALTELALSMHSGTATFGSVGSFSDFTRMACWAFQWAAPLFFPMIPLLLTAVVLEDKPLGCLGLVILVLCLAYLAVNLLPGAASGQSLLVFSALVALVKDFLPPIALLLTARRLKKLPEGA